MIASCWHAIAYHSPPMPENILLFLLFPVAVADGELHRPPESCGRQTSILDSISSRLASEKHERTSSAGPKWLPQFTLRVKPIAMSAAAYGGAAIVEPCAVPL